MAELHALLVTVLLVTLPVLAETPPIGIAQLTVQGSRLTLYGDSQTVDWDQTVNVGEAIRIRTCYGTLAAACGSATASDPSLAGLKVVGELSGPELPQPLSFETIPGGSFFLPGFQTEGDYVLSNIRLVESATSRVLGTATPSAAAIHVRQILLASATVTRLSLADLQARGIAITQESFQAFNFAVGFAFQGQTITINLPVLFQGNGTVGLLGKPSVPLDGLPPDVQHAVSRWEPPNIVPFQLTGAPGIPQDPAKDEPDPVDPDTPLYGAIVLPGNVSFLNQFFDAKLIVASGAPSGGGATLRNVYGALRLPGADVLRMAATIPPVGAGQHLTVLKTNDDGVLARAVSVDAGSHGWGIPPQPWEVDSDWRSAPHTPVTAGKNFSCNYGVAAAGSNVGGSHLPSIGADAAEKNRQGVERSPLGRNNHGPLASAGAPIAGGAPWHSQRGRHFQARAGC